MKKLLSCLALFSIALGCQQGSCEDDIRYCDDPYYDDGYGRYPENGPVEGLQTSHNDICDDGCYPCKESGGPPIYVYDKPTYNYRMRCEEKEIPVRRLCSRPVQRQYEVQRVKYIPQYYTETITRTEIEYYYVNSVDIRQNWICEKNCEYTPTYCSQTPCPGETSMTPSYGRTPINYPKPFGGKECP